MKKISTLLLFLLVTAGSFAQIRYFKGLLSGNQEVPARSTPGSGVVIAKYDVGTKTLELFGNYANLTTAIVNAHIHRGPAGANGPVFLPLAYTDSINGIVSGSVSLSQNLEDSLLSGNTYVNIHSRQFSGGEIRAQLVPASDGQTEWLSGQLQGAQEVPPNSSPATGFTHALVDRTTDSIFLTGAFLNLTSNISMAHIHSGLPHVNGGVLVHLVVAGHTSGTLHLATSLSSTNRAMVLNGLTYVNVHSVNFPGGEIRAQLTNFSQQQYLVAELKGSNEVPPVTTNARGITLVQYNPQTNRLRLTGNYEALTDTITGSHIHIGLPGNNGAVIIPLTNTSLQTGIVIADEILPDSLENALLTGNTYVNIHSKTFRGGEIRGQLIPTSSGETHVLTANLQGVQEVPANNSEGGGLSTVFLDRYNLKVYGTSTFLNLTDTITMAHIHIAPAGTNGRVILPLTFDGFRTGTMSGTGTLTEPVADSMIRGFTYVNVHSKLFPGGEIRGQLGNLVLPVKLQYFNGYRQHTEVKLVWQSAEELNLKIYEIEQLAPTGNKWIKKGTVTAGGVSISTQYTFTDIPHTTASKYATYRLKMIDYDGTVMYSPTVRIALDKATAQLKLLNNPVVGGVLRFTLTGLPQNEPLELALIDLNGRIVYRAKRATAIVNSLPVYTLPQGQYKLLIATKGSILQQSFLK